MNRRKLLTRIVQGFTITGLGFVTYPFLKAWIPKFSHDLGLDVDITSLAPGESKQVHWLGRNLYVQRRTQQSIAALQYSDIELKDPHSDDSTQPEFATNIYRSLIPGIFVTYTNCTHLGCEVLPDGGVFKCPCHQSDYDAAGRVVDGAAAPTNLEVPSYRFISRNVLRLEKQES